MRRTFAAIVLAVGLPSWGAEPSAVEAEAEACVRRLGSDLFDERETAERRLLRLGGASRRPVRDGLKSGDPEVVRRCETLGPRIDAAFRKAAADGTAAFSGPAWERFRKLVGDDAPAKILFAEMTLNPERADLLDHATGDQASALSGTAEAIRRRDARANEHLFVIARMRSAESFSPGEVATALYLGSLPVAGNRFSVDLRQVFDGSFDALLAGPAAKTTARLFAAWLAARTNPDEIRVGFEAALEWSALDVLAAARRVAADPKTEARLLASALNLIAVRGGTDDVESCRTLKGDTRVYHYAGSPGRHWHVQVRDLAAATALRLSGRDAFRLGFEPRTTASIWDRKTERPVVLANLRSDDERDKILSAAWAAIDAKR